jgi:hypothetical protein
MIACMNKLEFVILFTHINISLVFTSFIILIEIIVKETIKLNSNLEVKSNIYYFFLSSIIVK